MKQERRELKKKKCETWIGSLVRQSVRISSSVHETETETVCVCERREWWKKLKQEEEEELVEDFVGMGRKRGTWVGRAGWGILCWEERGKTEDNCQVGVVGTV